jgi:hypothetical protein
MSAHKRARSEGGQVLLVIADAAVLRIFAITALDRVIPNFTSLDEALAQTEPGHRGGVHAADCRRLTAVTTADSARREDRVASDAGGDAMLRVQVHDAGPASRTARPGPLAWTGRTSPAAAWTAGGRTGPVLVCCWCARSPAR